MRIIDRVIGLTLILGIVVGYSGHGSKAVYIFGVVVVLVLARFLLDRLLGGKDEDDGAAF